MSIMPGSLLTLVLLLSLCCSLRAETFREEEEYDYSAGMRPCMVKKEKRKSLMVNEYGEISAVDISRGTKGTYHLEFMTLEPNCLFLPVLLHADMVFYVKTGSGKLSWAEDGKEMKRVNLKRGDVFRLHPGSIFFLQSSLEPERQKLRIHAIYSNTDEDVFEPSIGAYSSIQDLVLGFDKRILQSAFKVPDDVIEELTSSMRPPGIVHAVPEKKSMFLELEARFLKALTGGKDDTFYSINGGKKKIKTFNIIEADPDFVNCNGWSVTVGGEDLKSLKGSNIGVFMVNLTKGSMMGPHWNPLATEIAIVVQGRGMVRVVCASNLNETECKNMSFRVEEGDMFAVPRFHPMAQMSFNNDSFVFVGFSTSTGRNYPQFLAGKRSVLQTLNKQILALSFNVTNTTIEGFLTPQEYAIILDCTSCAEEEEIIMKEEMERERQEKEAREREEERKREEEERKREEEEERKRQEEEERKREEEERKREEEEERKRQEEEERKRQEEEERKREEEERKREEEEERKRQEEEERKRQEEEEEERKREEEEEAEKEKEDARKREEEEERRRKEKERREKAQEEAERMQREEKKGREEAARREQEEARREKTERQMKQKEEEARKEKEREKQGGESHQPEEEKQRGEPGKEEEEEREGGSRLGRKAARKVWKI